MLGFLGKNGDLDRIQSSLREVQDQITRCKSMICECDVDLQKYDSIMEEIKSYREGNITLDEAGETVNILQEKEQLLAKEQKLLRLSEKIANLESEYQNFIEEKKRELQNPEAELSRIKVEVKNRKEEIKEISFEQELAKLPEFVSQAEGILRNLQMKSEQRKMQMQDAPKEVPPEMIENTRKWIEDDEQKLYAVRKAVHTSKEILSFMEFRLPELDRMLSKSGSNDLREEWSRLQQDKQICERYVNEQILLAKRAADRLFEVKRAIDQQGGQQETMAVDTSAEEDFQSAIDYMKVKMGEFQDTLIRFMQKKELWNQEITSMEIKLEELWNSL